MTYVFPAIQALTAVCAAVVYGAHGELAKAIYWAAACVITIAVTFA